MVAGTEACAGAAPAPACCGTHPDLTHPHPAGLQGALTVGSLALLQRAARRAFGGTVAAGLMLLTALQFHLPFYLSRTLPNVLAMPLTSAGLAAWLGGATLPPVYLLTAAAVRAGGGAPCLCPCYATLTTMLAQPSLAAASFSTAAFAHHAALATTTLALPPTWQVIFRCDMLLLVGLVGLHLLAARRISLARAVLHGGAAVAASLALSVAADSLFWRRWLWPEGEVLHFNTVLNKWVRGRQAAWRCSAGERRLTAAGA